MVNLQQQTQQIEINTVFNYKKMNRVVTPVPLSSIVVQKQIKGTNEPLTAFFLHFLNTDTNDSAQTHHLAAKNTQ